MAQASHYCSLTRRLRVAAATTRATPQKAPANQSQTSGEYNVLGSEKNARPTIVIVAPNRAPGKNTSIRVDFNESLDGSTIQVTDFKADDVTPLSVEWFSGRSHSVFLNVPAMAPNARPKIELVGEVTFRLSAP